MKQKALTMMVGAAMLLAGVIFVAPLHAATRPGDDDITLWVTAAVGQDPRVHDSDIVVTCRDGVVTLTGEVASLAARNFADMEAKKIRGVIGVVNELSVKPADRSDQTIRAAVMSRLRGSRVVHSTDLDATSIDGSVHLFGTVDSWAEREQAGLLASEVAGVKNLVNDIHVKWSASRTDDEIKGDVEASLVRDVYLSDLPITVAVHDGVVTLAGTVGNAYERDRAERGARWVRGVAKVVDALAVDWSENEGVVAARPAPTDAELGVRVREALDADLRIDPTRISIHADMGEVTLEGTVNSREERTIAANDARDVVGVAWVTNQLAAQVDARDDLKIRDDVQYRLDTDYATADLGLDAEVHHGVVTLDGETFNWFERSRAANIAAAVPGVREVDNLITVSPSARKIDRDLTASIEHHLTWNWRTWRVHDDIGVTVRNGVATLTGAVDTWSERAEATDVALDTPGIWKVDNRITIDGYNYPWSEFYYSGPYEYGSPNIE